MASGETAKHLAAAEIGRSLGLAAVPPSKSAMNRALVLACLAEGESLICWGGAGQSHPPYDGPLPPETKPTKAQSAPDPHGQRQLGGQLGGAALPDDVALMCGGLKALGCELALEKGGIRVFGGRRLRAIDGGAIDAGSAGAVLRFLLPLAALHCDGPIEFSGSERLFERPHGPLLDALARLGAEWRWGAGGRPGGTLEPIGRPTNIADLELEIDIDGGLSSQFISGLAMAVAGLGRKPEQGPARKPEQGPAHRWRLKWAHEPASIGYLRMTQDWLGRFGCAAQLHDGGLDIPVSGLSGGSHRAYGDWGAAAALFCAAAALDGEIRVHPLSFGDCQPDSAILRILEKAGSTWLLNGDCCHFKGGLKKGIEADLASCPDLVPTLAAAAALAPGESALAGLGALPHKESDRLNGCKRLAEWLGARCEIMDGPSLRIHGIGPVAVRGATRPIGAFDPMGDHRMAFGAAIGALRLGGTVLDPSCVSKSFPGFWDAIADGSG